MGKAGKWSERAWQSGAWYGQDWRSQSNWRAQKGSEPDGTQQGAKPILKYDQVQLADDSKPDGGQAVEKPLALSMVQAVQRAVNTARKATAKVVRLEEDIARRRQQWVVFKDQMKAAVLQQKSQFEKDLARIQKEIMEAQQQSIEADAKLKAIVSGDSPAAVDVKMETVDAASSVLEDVLDIDPWDLTTDAEDKKGDDAIIAAYLKNAMTKARMEIGKLKNATPTALPTSSTPPPRPNVALTTPLRSTTGGGPMTPFFQGRHGVREQPPADDGQNLTILGPPAQKRTKLMEGATLEDPYLGPMGSDGVPFHASPSAAVVATALPDGSGGMSAKRSPVMRGTRYAPRMNVRKPTKAMAGKDHLQNGETNSKKPPAVQEIPSTISAAHMPVMFNLLDDDLDSPIDSDGVDGLGNME